MTSTQPIRASAGLAYGLLGLPLAFVALPLYVLLPNHYAREFGMPLATLGAVWAPSAWTLAPALALSQAHETPLIRSVQEALTNIARHAGARDDERGRRRDVERMRPIAARAAGVKDDALGRLDAGGLVAQGADEPDHVLDGLAAG